MADPKPELAKRAPTPSEAIYHYANARKNALQKILPTGHQAERFIHIAISNIARNPALAQTTPESFYSSVQWLAQMGLEPGGPDQLAYLVPYKDQCQPQVGYRGMIQIAINEGKIKKINAVVVYENDDFEYSEGLSPDIKHKPKMNGPRGAMKYVYAYAILPSGEHAFVVMNEDEINKHKARSLAARSERDTINMWRDFPEQAWKKTAIRELYKYLPHTEKMTKAIERDLNSEIQKATDLKDFSIDELASAPTKADAIADRVFTNQAAMDAQIVEEDHTLDEIVRLVREAQSPIELSAPKNMRSRLTNDRDKKLVDDLISEKEREFTRGGKK